MPQSANGFRQARLHRADGNLQQMRDFCIGVLFYVTEFYHFAQLGRQIADSLPQTRLPILPKYDPFRLHLFWHGDMLRFLNRQTRRILPQFALVVEQMVLAYLEQVRRKLAGRLIRMPQQP